MRKVALFLVAAAALAQTGMGRRAPGFALIDQKSKLHDLYDYRGRVVLLDFMNTDCPHCKTFSKILQDAGVRYGQRLVVLSVVLPPDPTSTVARYADENGVKTPFLFDCGQAAFSYIRPKTSAINLPHLFIINREGYIAGDYEYGPSTKEIFEGKGLISELSRIVGPPGTPL